MTTESMQRSKIIVGTPDFVANALLVARDRGVLGRSMPAVHHLPDGRVMVKAQMLEVVHVPAVPAEVPSRVPVRLSRRTRLLVGAGVVLVGVVGLAGYAGYMTDVDQVRQAGRDALGAAVLVILVLLGLAGVTSGAACRGFHCPGCPHR
jgi:hypothetical protein